MCSPGSGAAVRTAPGVRESTTGRPWHPLAASFVTGIYRPLIRRKGSEQHYVRVSRLSAVVLGLILALLAYGFSHFEKILWLAFMVVMAW